jgi:transposase
MQRRDRWQGEWFLHHDNALSHTSLLVLQFIAEKSISVIVQPPYSLDLVLSDIWLFPALKMGLKGACFTTMEDKKSNVTAKLRKIPKEAFCQCFQQWQDRRSKWVCVQASYFEDD